MSAVWTKRTHCLPQRKGIWPKGCQPTVKDSVAAADNLIAKAITVIAGNVEAAEICAELAAQASAAFADE